MRCLNCNTDFTNANHPHGKIEKYTDESSCWIGQKENDRIRQQTLSKNLTTLKTQRKQLPSISPTSEDMFSEAGHDYGTYFAYKYRGIIPVRLHK